ncbi:hypothetical protein DPMN_187419 [Dreissena polymorpha]|uniref:Uncharacterized protein n=1 Tax=Dreissena polymorpha TaxID=45954 RepID=A0A9D4DPP7_DREPO|nr:hypothetical protein DPMN_187419 [Dreissena polymorpha]
MDMFRVSGSNLSKAFAVQHAMLVCMCIWIHVNCTKERCALAKCEVLLLRLQNKATLLCVISALYIVGAVAFAIQFYRRPDLDARAPRRRVVAWVASSAFPAVIMWFSINQIWKFCPFALLMLIPYAVCIFLQIPMYWNLWTN